MKTYEKDLQNLKEKDPKSEDELIETLGISFSSPEAYYVSIVLDWLRTKTNIPLEV